MDANRMTQKMYTNRVRGRPKLRWFDDVREDLRIFKVKDWRFTAMDRDTWRLWCRRPSPTKGCRASWWWIHLSILVVRSIHFVKPGCKAQG
jgi:hypothetical protein